MVSSPMCSCQSIWKSGELIETDRWETKDAIDIQMAESLTERNSVKKYSSPRVSLSSYTDRGSTVFVTHPHTLKKADQPFSMLYLSQYLIVFWNRIFLVGWLVGFVFHVVRFGLVWFGLFWFYGISNRVGCFMPNPIHTYVLNIYDLETFI